MAVDPARAVPRIFGVCWSRVSHARARLRHAGRSKTVGSPRGTRGCYRLWPKEMPVANAAKFRQSRAEKCDKVGVSATHEFEDPMLLLALLIGCPPDSDDKSGDTGGQDSAGDSGGNEDSSDSGDSADSGDSGGDSGTGDFSTGSGGAAGTLAGTIAEFFPSARDRVGADVRLVTAYCIGMNPANGKVEATGEFVGCTATFYSPSEDQIGRCSNAAGMEGCFDIPDMGAYDEYYRRAYVDEWTIDSPEVFALLGQTGNITDDRGMLWVVPESAMDENMSGFGTCWTTGEPATILPNRAGITASSLVSEESDVNNFGCLDGVSGKLWFHR